jgi:arylamine N-acetyltransferase
MASSYDITLDPMSLGDYQERCTLLQTDPESTFVKFAIVSRRNECGYEVLRNVTHIDVVEGETSKRHITDVDDYRDTLARLLGVDLGDEVDTLWTIVNERVAAQAAASDQGPADEVR